MKAVYTSKEDKWRIFLGNEEIAIIDREHTYSKQILRNNKNLRFSSRNFGEKLLELLLQKVSDFSSELLINKEATKEKSKFIK